MVTLPPAPPQRPAHSPVRRPGSSPTGSGTSPSAADCSRPTSALCGQRVPPDRVDSTSFSNLVGSVLAVRVVGRGPRAAWGGAGVGAGWLRAPRRDLSPSPRPLPLWLDSGPLGGDAGADGFPEADALEDLQCSSAEPGSLPCRPWGQPLTFPGRPLPAGFASLLVTVTGDVSMCPCRLWHHTEVTWMARISQFGGRGDVRVPVSPDLGCQPHRPVMP